MKQDVGSVKKKQKTTAQDVSGVLLLQNNFRNTKFWGIH